MKVGKTFSHYQKKKKRSAFFKQSSIDISLKSPVADTRNVCRRMCQDWTSFRLHAKTKQKRRKKYLMAFLSKCQAMIVTWGIGKWVAYWMCLGCSYNWGKAGSIPLSLQADLLSCSGAGFSGEGLPLDSQCIGGENICKAKGGRNDWGNAKVFIRAVEHVIEVIIINKSRYHLVPNNIYSYNMEILCLPRQN